MDFVALAQCRACERLIICDRRVWKVFGHCCRQCGLKNENKYEVIIHIIWL